MNGERHVAGLNSSRSRTVIRWAAVAVLAVTGVLSLTVLPIRDTAVSLLDRVRELGPGGAVILALAWIPACLFFVPGSLLSLGAGFAFGVVQGTIAVSLGSVAGATAAFLAGRLLVRDWIADRVAGSPRFAAIDSAVEKQGFRIVLLTRLSPVFPFNLLNYAYGLTRVRLRDYVLASWIGMFPGTVMFVYLGSAMESLASLAAGDVKPSLGRDILFYIGLGATVIVTVLITRMSRRALRQSVGPLAKPPESAATSRAAES